MSNVEVISNTATKQAQGKEQRLQWQKPQAKVAEVATATLSHSSVYNTHDLATCAS